MCIRDRAPTREECVYLLEFEETSMESSMIRAVSNDIIRRNSENSAIILGQIGVDITKCPGGCKFCTFGEDHKIQGAIRGTYESHSQRAG